MYLVHFILADRTSCAVHAVHADCALLLCATQFDLSKFLNRSELCGSNLFQIVQCTQPVQFAQLAQFITLVGVRGCTSVLSLCVKRVRAVLVDRKLQATQLISRNSHSVRGARI